MKAAVFLILSLFSITAQAELDLTLPKIQYDPDYRKNYRCNFEPKQILPKLQFREGVTRKDRYIFYTLQVLDVWSTNRAISSGYAKELNPLLPNYPSLDRLILHKTLIVGAYEYAQWMDNKSFVVTMNWVMAGVVVNNVHIILDNEYR